MHLSQSLNSFPPSATSFNPSMIPLKGEMTGTAYVWPTIESEQFKSTMDNYREHVAKYNEGVLIEMAEINAHNAAVDNEISGTAICESKTPFIKLFYKKFKNLKKRDYNKEVAQFCQLHGYYIKQVTFQKIKPPSINVFEAILHAYSVKLKEHTAILQGMGINYVTSLPKAEIHPFEIKEQMRNGHRNMDYTTKTIRAHRARLTEAGVLTEYEYCGTKRPVKNSINAAILVVKDEHLRLIRTTENQSVTSQKRKKVPYNKVSTYSNIKQLENKEIVNNNPQYKESGFATQNNLNYLTTISQEAKTLNDSQAQKGKPAAKNENKVPLNPKTVSALRSQKANRGRKIETSAGILAKIGVSSQNEMPAASQNIKSDQATPFLSMLDPRAALKQKLTAGIYNFYRPIDTTVLKHLQNTNIITNAQYRELLLQDFIKDAAKIWTLNQGNEGSWCTAIKKLDKLFGNINMAGVVKSKSDCYDKLMELRYRLNWAYTWFKNKKYKGVWFPSVYFDSTRDKPQDVCFAYTKKVWSAKMAKQQKEANKKRSAAAAKRKRDAGYAEAAKNNRKMDAAIWAYLRKEKSLIELQSIITKLPQLQQEKFPLRLKKLNENRNAKNLK